MPTAAWCGSRGRPSRCATPGASCSASWARRPTSRNADGPKRPCSAPPSPWPRPTASSSRSATRCPTTSALPCAASTASRAPSRRTTATSLDEEARGYILRIRTATQRMGQIIDDLLLLSRVARAEIRRERVDLTAVAREVDAALAVGRAGTGRVVRGRGRAPGPGRRPSRAPPPREPPGQRLEVHFPAGTGLTSPSAPARTGARRTSSCTTTARDSTWPTHTSSSLRSRASTARASSRDRESASPPWPASSSVTAAACGRRGGREGGHLLLHPGGNELSAMSRRLRALIVEDEEQDVPLLVRELRRAGYEVTHERVDTRGGPAGRPRPRPLGHRALGFRHATLRRPRGASDRPGVGPRPALRDGHRLHRRGAGRRGHEGGGQRLPGEGPALSPGRRGGARGERRGGAPRAGAGPGRQAARAPAVPEDGGGGPARGRGGPRLQQPALGHPRLRARARAPPASRRPAAAADG